MGKGPYQFSGLGGPLTFMRRGAVSSYFQASSSPLPLRLQCNLGGGLTSLDAAESGDVEMTMEAQEHFILVVSLNIFRGGRELCDGKGMLFRYVMFRYLVVVFQDFFGGREGDPMMNSFLSMFRY